MRSPAVHAVLVLFPWGLVFFLTTLNIPRVAFVGENDGGRDPQGSSDTLIWGWNNHLHLVAESTKLHLTLEATELSVIGP